LAELLLPLLNRRPVMLGEEPEPPERLEMGTLRQEWVPRLVLAALLLYATTSALLRTTGLGGEAPLLVGLSKDERAAMSWVAKQTPPESRFLVVPDSGWEAAKTAEWFPLLAQRRSVATVQGTEWLPAGRFDHQVWAYQGAYECGYRTADCLDMWSTETGIEFTYVYFARSGSEQCCWTLTSSLNLDPRYQIVYQSKGATIFRRVDGPPAAAPDLAQRP
jgi:hypothetical protein